MLHAELLALDLGTSSVKVGVFAGDGRLLSFSRRAYDLVHVAGEAAEQDPEQWWSSTAAAIREAATDLDLQHVKAVCVGGQGPTLVLVDADGRPVRPALTWMDTRSTRESTKLSEILGSDRASFSLVPRLLWVSQHEPQNVARARWALQAWDFIAGRLGGGRVAAASTFAGDVVWRRDWLQAAGLGDSRLIPPAVDAGVAYAETGGHWAEEAGIPSGIRIVGGMNDGVGSIVGASGSVVGRATDPGGAAGGLALCWPERLSAPGVDCWPGLVPNTFIVGGAFVAGGRAMDWWASVATQGDLLQALALAENAPAGGNGLVCLPFLAGERSPLWDPTARGAIIGLTFGHGPAHLARAVLESTAYELRLMSDAILNLGARIDELRVCGGQAQSRLWNQIKADVTGLPVSVPRLPEVALMGDAICAALGAGLYPDLSTAAEEMVQVGEVLEPRLVHRQVYDELFGVYQAAYGALKPLFPALSRAASL
ncbi:MAG TPA: FGGY-family carbohydrate kinase [Chloroflexota bacterium]|nr:FGGY-family carbohydrate kinase [Chloroflexota bacterium]